jgi:general nucleoside transport system ATP-binding protein
MAQPPSDPAPARDVVVRMRDISKYFPGVVANEKVSLELRRGEIHAVLGENGAGKTTVMNILYGLYSADGGTIEVEGREVHIGSPHDALALGIGMVHQHFMLIPKFTVVENIVLGNEPRRAFALDLGAARARVRDLSERFGLYVDPDRKVEDASVGMQQRAEILKALYAGARILILDEPTAVLAPQEVDDLFQTIRSLTERGLSIFFISHKLEEVTAISDRVTVIRQGRVVETLETARTDKQQLARLMVGRDVVLQVARKPHTRGRPVLEVHGLEARDQLGLEALKGIDLTVHEGEIVGIAGVDGNGQVELEEVLAGTRPATGGRITMQGEDVTRLSVRGRIDRGIGHIPQDRHRDGLILDFSLTENLLLGNQWKAPFARTGRRLDYRRLRRRAREGIEAFAVRTPSEASPARTLSGGNQQKLILAREIGREPAFLIAAQPTRGLDVGAIEFVHEQLLGLRERGVAILLVSYELEELASLADRILVMYEGRIVLETAGDEADWTAIGLAMTGGRGRGEVPAGETAAGDLGASSQGGGET